MARRSAGGDQLTVSGRCSVASQELLRAGEGARRTEPLAGNNADLGLQRPQPYSRVTTQTWACGVPNPTASTASQPCNSAELRRPDPTASTTSQPCNKAEPAAYLTLQTAPSHQRRTCHSAASLDPWIPGSSTSGSLTSGSCSGSSRSRTSGSLTTTFRTSGSRGP